MKISVYITSYNQRAYLEQAVVSVLAQTLQPFEIVIIDDASSDGSQALVNAFADKHPGLIRTRLHSQNLGIARTRAQAIEMARGDFITYLDGDDLYRPGKLEREAEVIRETGADVAFSNFHTFADDPGNPTSIWARSAEELPAPGDLYFDVLTRNFPRNALFRNELISREAVAKTGPYDPELTIYEDYEWKIRMAAVSQIHYTSESLLLYRDNPAGLSKRDAGLHLEVFDYICDKHRDEIRQRLPDRAAEAERRLAKFRWRIRRMQMKQKLSRSLRRLVGRTSRNEPGGLGD